MGGGCFCGAIRYRLTAPVDQAYYCHCGDCRKLSGAAYQVLAIVPRGSLEFTRGEPAALAHPTEDGSTMTRYFCARCGTPIYNDSSRFTDIHMVSVPSLDDPEAVEPSFEIWTRSKSRHGAIADGLHSYPQGAEDG